MKGNFSFTETLRTINFTGPHRKRSVKKVESRVGIVITNLEGKPLISPPVYLITISKQKVIKWNLMNFHAALTAAFKLETKTMPLKTKRSLPPTALSPVYIADDPGTLMVLNEPCHAGGLKWHYKAAIIKSATQTSNARLSKITPDSDDG